MILTHKPFSGKDVFIIEAVELEPLREDKQKIFEEITAYLDTHRMGYIKVPTGWGKTFLSKHIMKKYYTEGKLVLFLVSRNNHLLNQTYYDRKKGLPLFPNSTILSSEHKVDKNELVIKLQERNSESTRGFVFFASLQTVLSKNNTDLKRLLLEKTDLLIVDEIHNFINNKGNDFLNDFSEKTKILGMTATPFQGVVGSVKFVEEIAGDMREVYGKNLPECILDGELADLKYTIAQSTQDILEIFDFEKGLDDLDRQDLFLDCSTAEKLDKVIRRTRLAKDVYEAQIKDKHSKTLVFCAPVRKQVHGLESDKKALNAFHAKLCAAVFNGEVEAAESAAGLETVVPSVFENYAAPGKFKDAVYISSELPKDEQTLILQAFKNTGKAPYVLCTVGMLIEGFDFPEMEALILLRPTLSMRLFEQQIGRVTRLSPASEKTRGNIFEIADNIDSLYQRFGDSVFGGQKAEQIEMLQPEIRLEELFSEGDAAQAIETGKIQIRKIDLNSRHNEFREVLVRLPPTDLRARYFSRLLAITEEKDIGAFEREKKELMREALKFKVQELKDAKEISELARTVNRLKREAYEDHRLGDASRKVKPKVFGEVEWILKLRALTCLKYCCGHLPLKEKSMILKTLGFEGNIKEIDYYRLKCLKLGSEQKTIPELLRVVRFVNRLSSAKTYQFIDKKQKDKWTRELLPAIYWGACFVDDYPEIKELFESKEWDSKVKNFIKMK